MDYLQINLDIFSLWIKLNSW